MDMDICIAEGEHKLNFNARATAKAQQVRESELRFCHRVDAPLPSVMCTGPCGS